MQELPKSQTSENSAPQRRQHFRVPVSPVLGVTLKLWRLPHGESLQVKPLPSWEIKAVIREVSQGGLSLAVAGVEGVPIFIGADERVKLEISYREGTFVLEGKLRRTSVSPLPGGTLLTGIQFRARMSDKNSREAMSHIKDIVSMAQRAQLRARAYPTPAA